MVALMEAASGLCGSENSPKFCYAYLRRMDGSAELPPQLRTALRAAAKGEDLSHKWLGPPYAKQPQTTQTTNTQHYHKTHALVPQITPTTSFPGLDVG